MKKSKSFILIWLGLLIIMTIPIIYDRTYSKEDLQYIQIDSAEIEYQSGDRYDAPFAIINDIYYLPLKSSRFGGDEEYKNLKTLAETEKITVGVVDNRRLQILQLNPKGKLVLSLNAGDSAIYTLESYNSRMKTNLRFDIIPIFIYLAISLLYCIAMYFLGERKLRKKIRRFKKKRRKKLSAKQKEISNER